MNSNQQMSPAAIGALVTGVIVVLIALLVGSIFAMKAVGRYQGRQDRNQSRQQAVYDANNQVHVNNIRIRYFEQSKHIAQQQADIRYIDATGIRRAQDEISSTLTPLYVQFEMVDALKKIAQSGRNSSVVYIPTGANGIPLISDATKGKVAKP